MAKVVVVDSGEQIRKKRRWWLWLPLALLLIITLATAGFIFWATSTNPVMPEAYSALESTDAVTVNALSWIAFVPHDAPPTTGLIFYPGGKVLAEAYAPLAHRIAEAGYLVVIVYAPLNLAIFNPNAADPVIDHFSAVENWAVGGHSLGGVAAAIYAANHLDIIEGIAFLGSLPPDNTLANSNIQAVSIFATNDLLETPENVAANHSLLPATTQYVEILGGNHAQFGYYGAQTGDGEATISREEQQTQTANAIIRLLNRLDN